ncbi:MAG TPA: hypothetical protein DEA82_03645 [Flavobacteriaceae bacterium]|jgi:hypothetical protein|nr:hypothetical protein [Flavobacteriaceae bacterium]|tara:strand:- start:172457 stop:174292 length:1836 start_codon:yes stop_codon:yes gene_type:complete
MAYLKNTLVLLMTFAVAVSNAQEIVWEQTEPFTTKNIRNKTGRSVNTIRIEKKIEVNGTVEIPTNITLAFGKNGSLLIANEATFLIVNGPIIAGKQHIFDVSAKGVGSYRSESISNIALFQAKTFYPEWWGVFPNVIPGKENTIPKAAHHIWLKEMMLDVAASGGGSIEFSEGVYYIRDLIIDFDNIKVYGQGKNKTILRFDRANFGYSTRRGGIVTIQGPTAEKYYSKMVPDGVPIMGNFSYEGIQHTIENIEFKDIGIEWDAAATVEDPAMNGLAIVNARNVMVNNVHVSLYGANRAYFVGNSFEGDVTENITIQNSSCDESRTGVFILIGYAKDENPRKKLIIDDIKILNNKFDLMSIQEIDVKNPHITLKYLDKYSSGVYFIGNEYTSSFTTSEGQYIERITGDFLIEGNTFNNADFGIRSWYGNKDEFKGYVHRVNIKNNVFNNFRYFGIMAPFNTANIENNTLSVETLVPIPLTLEEDRGENYSAAAIYVAKAPWSKYKSDHGPEKVTVNNNKITGCFIGTNPIVIQPKEGGTVEVVNNSVSYDPSCQKPNHEIVFTTNRRQFRTKRATLIIGNNKDTSNLNPSDASLLLDVRREKHITLIDNER